MQHYTSMNQSKRLLEIGISPDTADMYYNPPPSRNIPHIGHANTSLIQLPAWSLSALIELLPNSIHNFDLWIRQNNCCYFRIEETGATTICYEEKADNTFNVVYNMVIKLKTTASVLSVEDIN